LPNRRSERASSPNGQHSEAKVFSSPSRLSLGRRKKKPAGYSNYTRKTLFARIFFGNFSHTQPSERFFLSFNVSGAHSHKTALAVFLCAFRGIVRAFFAPCNRCSGRAEGASHSPTLRSFFRPFEVNATLRATSGVLFASHSFDCIPDRDGNFFFSGVQIFRLVLLRKLVLSPLALTLVSPPARPFAA
jgi:hypothetical protein